MMKTNKINKLAVITASFPYFLLGYPWFSVFRDTWFFGGGLTVEQLENGPSLAVAFTVAIISALTTSTILAYLMYKTNNQTALKGIKLAFLLWLGFIGLTLATQYTFEARTLGYYAVTAGYPLLGLSIMAAIIGAWRK